jgi:hypothetical protein
MFAVKVDTAATITKRGLYGDQGLQRFCCSCPGNCANAGEINPNFIRIISAQDNREHLASLYSTLEFPNDNDAEAYGFTMAEKWIHSRPPSSGQRKTVSL